MAETILDLNSELIADKSELMQFFKNSLGFLDTFGGNWDALYDSLAEFLNRRGESLRMRVVGPVSQEAKENLEACREIVQDLREVEGFRQVSLDAVAD